MSKYPLELLAEYVKKSFSVPKSGLYAISITARCDVSSDLRIEIDDRYFRENPPKENIQKFDIPPAWSGTKLKGLQQTNIFLIRLEEGDHTISFIQKGSARIEEWDYWQIDDPSNIVIDFAEKTENGDGRPFISFILIDLPLQTLVAEASLTWHLFDGDDIKLIIDNKIEPNPSLKKWKDWIFHATPINIISRTKKIQKKFTKNLTSGIHYVEFWTDRTPTIHSITLNLGSWKDLNSPTVDKPEWTGNFSDDTDQIILARALFGEARKSLVPDIARFAIGWVIKNRVESKRWPDTYGGVITEDGQFSSFKSGDDNLLYVRNPHLDNNDIDKKAWEHAYEIAGRIINNEIPDPTKGANHFYDDSINTPPWAANETPALVVPYINEFERKVTVYFLKL